MNTMRKVPVFVLFILIVSLFPPVHAIEPEWIYPMNGVEIGNIAVSTDGSTIIVAAGNLWFFSKDGTLLKKETNAQKVVLTPDGRFAVSSFGGTLNFFRAPLTTGSTDPRQLNRIWESDLPNRIRSVDITDNGRTIVAATEGNGIFIITTETQKVFSNNTLSNTFFKISHDGSRIVGISADKIRIYSTNAKVSKNYNLASNLEPRFMALSQTIPLMVYNDGKTIHGVDLSIGTELWQVTATGTPTSLAMTPSGSFVIIGTEKGNIERYTDKGILSWSYSSNNQNISAPGITALAVSRDGGRVAAGSSDGHVFILDAGGKLLGSYKAKGPVQSITISNDGSFTLAADERNIYAFTSGPSSSPVSYYQFDPKNLTQGSLNNSVQNITFPPSPTTPPPISSPGPETPVGQITELPITYSIIRTATQSPVSEIIPLGGLFVAFMLLARRLNK
jgi:hypothetical protein